MAVPVCAFPPALSLRLSVLAPCTLTRHGGGHLEEDGAAGAQADEEGPPVERRGEGVCVGESSGAMGGAALSDPE